MSFYTNIKSFTSILPDLNYSLKHTSDLKYPEIVQSRIEALNFWNKHGLDAAVDHTGRSKSTLYLWCKKLEDSRKLDKRMGRASLKAIDPKCRRPKHCKEVNWDKDNITYIKKQAAKHWGIGRKKLHQQLSRRYRNGVKQGKCPSESTVGRILNWLRSTGRVVYCERLSFNARTGKLHILKRKITKKLRRKDLPFKVKYPGDLVQIDGIEGHYLGKHFYILNCIDYISEKAYSIIIPNKSSVSTAKVLASLTKIFGFNIKAIQTDNGSEFAARFHEMASSLGVKHCFNYVKKPIYNGKVERFNRTLQQELFHNLDFQECLVEDKPLAQKLINNFLDYYNNERPHSTLEQKDASNKTIHLTPNEYVLQWQQRKPAFS